MFSLYFTPGYQHSEDTFLLLCPYQIIWSLIQNQCSAQAGWGTGAPQCFLTGGWWLWWPTLSSHPNKHSFQALVLLLHFLGLEMLPPLSSLFLFCFCVGGFLFTFSSIQINIKSYKISKMLKGSRDKKNRCQFWPQEVHDRGVGPLIQTEHGNC